MWELIKWAFLDVKQDLVQNILKIEGDFLQNAFTLIFFVLEILIIALIIKMARNFYKLRKENKKIKKNIKKMIMTSFLAEDNKEKNT